MRSQTCKLMFASLCLMLFSTTAFADGILIGPCGNAVVMGNATPMVGPCLLAGGGTALYGGQAISGVNQFRNNHSPVLVTGGTGQQNVFEMTITSNPVWTVPGPVPTRLALNATITILEPGATVDVVFTGSLGGPPLVIQGFFAVSHTFSVEIFGMQAINPAATSTLIVIINGAGTFSAPGSGEFDGAIPEPFSLLLLGTGLTGVAMKLRRRGKSKAG